MRAPRSLDDNVTLLGTRFQLALGMILALILLLSVLGAAGWRNGVHFLTYVGLSPLLVWSGQAWRLATWSFFELDGLSLLFALLLVFFLGRDLCHAWGGGRFLRFWLGMTVATGGCVCLLGRLWLEVETTHYLSAWPVAEAMTVAWAVTYPSRTLFLNFVIPVQGIRLVYVQLAITAVYALLYGLALFVPHFIAMGLAWMYMGGTWSYWWLRFKVALTPARRARHLKPVGRNEPPTWYH